MLIHITNKYRFVFLIALLVLTWLINFNMLESYHQYQEPTAAAIKKAAIITNQKILVMRTKIIKLHQAYLAHQSISAKDIIWLNALNNYQHLLDITSQHSWHALLKKDGTFPTATIKTLVENAKKNNNIIELQRNKNPLNLLCAVSWCYKTTGNTYAYGIDFLTKNYHYLLPFLKNQPASNLHPIAFTNIIYSFSTFFNYVNSSDDYHQYRDLRALRRARRQSIVNWHNDNLTNLLNPKRILVN